MKMEFLGRGGPLGLTVSGALPNATQSLEGEEFLVTKVVGKLFGGL